MPATYNNLESETLALFRADIACGKPPNLAYYGKLGKASQLTLPECEERKFASNVPFYVLHIL